MTAFLCGQSDVSRGECVECGFGINGDGYPAQVGRVCSEDCAAGQSERLAEEARARHLRLRDLMCACGTCAAAGYPTDEDRVEYEAYQADTRTEHPAGGA